MADRIGIFGASGSGKTSVLYHELHRSKVARIVLVDPTAEARDWKGFRTVLDLRALKSAVKSSPARYRLAIAPPAGQEADLLSDLARFLIDCQASYKTHGQKLILAVDELNLAFPLHGAETRCPGFAELCSRGRRRGIELIAVSQRVAEVSQRFRGNLSGAVVLRQMGRSNIDAGADLIGVDPAQVRGLAQFDGLTFLAGSGELGKIRTEKIPDKP